MKLNKRYRRSIRSDLSFYIPATVLTMVTLVMFYLFCIAGTGIREYGDRFFTEHKLESASFMTSLPISEEEMAELSETYEVTLEAEHYINFLEKDYTARVFSRTESVDLYEITEGRDTEQDDEIIISEGFADNMSVALGDSLTVNKKSYTVVGFFLRPDYLYMLENTSDDYKNVTGFFLAYVTNEEFARFPDPATSYKVIYENPDREEEFRKYIYNNYYTVSYLSADENTRITFVDTQADMFVIGSWIILAILPFITVSLISIIIGRKVRNEQKLVGTLSALGYSRGRLMLHYSLFTVIPGLIGGTLSAVLAMLFAQPYGEIGLTDYEPLRVNFSLPVPVALAGILIPTLIYLLAGLLKVRKLLKTNTVTFLNGELGKRTRTGRILSRRKMPAYRKFAVRSLVGAPGRTLVLFLGAFIISFSYIFIDCIKAVGEEGKEHFGTFSEEYVLNTFLTEDNEDAEKMSILSFENTDGSRFSLVGADSDNTLWNLTLKKTGEKAELTEGWYASTLLLMLFDKEVGDEFTFRNSSSLEEFTVTIAGEIENNYQSYLISTREEASKITGLNAEYYNVLLSDHELSVDSGLVSEIVTDHTFTDQMQTMLDAMGSLIYTLVVIGMIICVAAIYVAVNMLVSESRSNISMLKVLGFSDSKINRILLNGNHLLVVPGIAAGMLLAYITMVIYAYAAVESEGMLLKVAFSGKSIMLTVLWCVVSYAISMLLVRRKAAKTDMVESLKDNRE